MLAPSSHVQPWLCERLWHDVVVALLAGFVTLRRGGDFFLVLRRRVSLFTYSRSRPVRKAVNRVLVSIQYT